MSEHETNNGYYFNPKDVENFYYFSDFALSARGKELVKNMESTALGAYLVGFAKAVDPIVAFEELPFLSLYVPSAINLESDADVMQGVEGADVPVLLFDLDHADDVMFPYLVAGQLFRLLQDLSDEEDKRILPMMQHSICYNPVMRIDSKTIFTKDYADMERACDVVALATLHQMYQNGADTQSFGFMRAQPHLQNLCDAIAQTAAFTQRSGMQKSDSNMARDLLLYMGHMATKHSADYDASLKEQALGAFKETMNNDGFEMLAQSEDMMAYGHDNDGDEEGWDEDDWDDEDAIDFDDLSAEEKDEIRKQIVAEFGNDVDIVGFGDDFDGDFGEGYNPPLFNSFQYALVSDTYERRDWAGSRWIEIVNDFLMKESEDKAMRIKEAFDMAAKNKADREIETYLKGDKVADKTPKKGTTKNTPKGPK